MHTDITADTWEYNHTILNVIFIKTTNTAVTYLQPVYTKSCNLSGLYLTSNLKQTYIVTHIYAHTKIFNVHACMHCFVCASSNSFSVILYYIIIYIRIHFIIN